MEGIRGQRRNGDIMLCGICKAREATVFYTEIMNGTKKEQYLCEECAAKSTSLRLKTPFGGKEFSLGGLISSLLEEALPREENEEEMQTAQVGKDITCPECGMSYAKFKEEGVLGCPSCYQKFGRALLRDIRSLQGADTHTGKHPLHFSAGKTTAHMLKDSFSLDEIQKLSLKLEQALEREDYDLAARLRDELRAQKGREAECAHE